MKLTNIAKFALGIAIFIMLLLNVGLSDVAITIPKINPLYFLPLYLLTFFRLAVTSFAVKILINPLKSLSFRAFHRRYLLSWIASLLLPGRIGDFSLSYFLRNETSIGKSMAAVFLDKVISLFFISLVSIFGYFLFFPTEEAIFYFIITIAVWVTIPLFLTERGRSVIRRILTKKFEGKFAGFSLTLFYFLRHRKSLLAQNAGLTAINWTIHTLITFLLFLAFGYVVDFPSLFIIVALSSFVSSVPITFNGLGIREGIFVFLLSSLGMSGSIAFSTALISLIINYSIALFLWIFLFKKEGRQNHFLNKKGKRYLAFTAQPKYHGQ